MEIKRNLGFSWGEESKGERVQAGDRKRWIFVKVRRRFKKRGEETKIPRWGDVSGDSAIGSRLLGSQT